MTRPSTAAPPDRTWAEPEYLEWLERQSMLHQAADLARGISGRKVQWEHPYAEPQPREAVTAASVWVLGYPGSVITRDGESVIATWADPELWKAFRRIGIDLLHTGPVKRSGGIQGRDYTPTIDGWFDRISLDIDPELGTDAEYRRMVAVAAEHGGLIAGDLVPLHTGLGADFRLAERAYKDYPGMYTMVEIGREHWNLLPPVEDLWSSRPVPKDVATELAELGYIPGLINSNDAVPDARELSGWAVTAEVPGADGRNRRWVYLHYFKPGQPTLNWLDPTSAAQRALAGDVVRTVSDFGSRVVRLDAVPFLGIERVPGSALTLHYQHPLSVLGTNYLAFLTRKLGGWSFQELNIPLVELERFTRHGPDLSYDFFTRAAYLHALLVGDAGLLRQAFGFLLESDLQPVSLVHDLQNHDEFTYQLVELDFRGDEEFEIGGNTILGRQLRERTLREMRDRAAGPAAPYNKLYRAERDGLATTTAGFIAASLEIRDPYRATEEEIDRIRQAHLLLAMVNAMQPGVFSLSSWDLVGALPLPEEQVADRMADADYRWINRGAVDLLGVHPDAETSPYGMPRARALYGSLPEQLEDPRSFVSRLREMLAARREIGIALGELIAVPEVDNPAVCVLAIQLPGTPRIALTVLNFGRETAEAAIDLASLVPEGVAFGPPVDVIRGAEAGEVDESGTFTVSLDPLDGTTVVIETRGAAVEAGRDQTHR